MLKLLKDYTPNVQEFNAGGGSMGFHIMTHLLQSSETLRLLLFLLDEGVGLMETYQVNILRLERSPGLVHLPE